MSERKERRKEGAWARPVTRLRVGAVPDGATNLNVEGRQVVSPLQGFGALWQKTYRTRLRGIDVTPAEVMKVWKEDFPKFQPPGNHFYPPMTGLEPGEIIFIESAISPVPGVLPGIPVASGVMVLYTDEEMFTIMTPEGFPESGWNTFSAFSEDGDTWVQVQSMARTADPVFEFGFRFMRGARFQEETWQHVVKAVAARFGVVDEPVDVNKVCVDSRLQWSAAKNVWHNAMLRSMVYMPLHLARRLLRRVR